jgi:ComF family protein
VLLDSEPFICSVCQHSLPIFDDNRDCVLQKLAGRVKAETAYSFLKFTKKGAAQKLLHALKYYHNKEIGMYLGHLLAQDMVSKNIVLEADYLIPVPLHPARLKERGYNQSEMIAEGISSYLNIPLKLDLLFKVRESMSQTKKGRVARLTNIFDCYEVKNGGAEKGIKVALVDDVITTGATLEACSTCLEKAGISHISLLSFAIA